MPRFGPSVVLLAFFAPAALAQADHAKFAPIRERMEQFIASDDIAGAVTVVGRKDGILHHEAVGHRDLRRAVPLDDADQRPRRRVEHAPAAGPVAHRRVDHADGSLERQLALRGPELAHDPAHHRELAAPGECGDPHLVAEPHHVLEPDRHERHPVHGDHGEVHLLTHRRHRGHHPHRARLARGVRAEEPEGLPPAYVHVDAADRLEAPERLAQPGGEDHGVGRRSGCGHVTEP